LTSGPLGAVSVSVVSVVPAHEVQVATLELTPQPESSAPKIRPVAASVKEAERNARELTIFL
jgi:hypothetical protein